MFILKNKSGLFVYGKIENKGVIPMFVKNTNKLYMVSVTLNNNFLTGIEVLNEISPEDNKVLFETTLNMINITLKKDSNNKSNTINHSF